MTWSDRCFCRCRHESGNLARSVVGERTNCSVRGAFSWWMPHVGASWSNKPIKKLVAHRRFGERRIRRRALKRDHTAARESSMS